MVSMEHYYEILHYLPSSRIDRQYPYDFKSPITLDGSSKVFRTCHSDYNGIDIVEAYVTFEESDVDVSDITLSFSPFDDGNGTLLSLNAVENDTNPDGATSIQFITDTNAKLKDLSILLTGVQSIKLDFGENITNPTIVDIIFRSRDYKYTLHDLEKAHTDGKNYVIRRLNELQTETEIDTVPLPLYSYVYMAGGAYAWLSQWEFEAKPMKEPKSESNNYADRLLGQVDTALQKYLSTIENDPNKEYVNMDLICTTKLHWGLH
jgi:hypothetical protein